MEKKRKKKKKNSIHDDYAIANLSRNKNRGTSNFDDHYLINDNTRTLFAPFRLKSFVIVVFFVNSKFRGSFIYTLYLSKYRVTLMKFRLSIDLNDLLY